MKNIIQFCVIFMTASMFMTSCGSSLSVTKRQHSKGYFVTSNKEYSTPTEKRKVEYKKKSVTNQATEKVAKVREAKKTTQLKSDFSETKPIMGVDKNKASASKSTKESNSDITSKNSSTDKKIEQSKDDQPRTIKTAINKVKSNISSSKDKDRSDDGLSLLWIIIIVLLILWALGLIGGLGSSGLLHLLLVIALVLMILWLLRII